MADFPRWPRLPFGINLEGALTKVETWANRLVDTLAADNVRLRRAAIKNSSDSLSLQGRVQLNSNLTDPDTTETFVEGQIRYNADTNKFQGYDGTAWRDFH
tara:strand:+ start:1532 stop:1834 length:303 start_codon:yes stop_codon:yes gene_type:complete